MWGDEDASLQTVAGVALCHGRYNTEVSSATAGNLVLIEGVDASIAKTATITAVPRRGQDVASSE